MVLGVWPGSLGGASPLVTIPPDFRIQSECFNSVKFFLC